MYTLFFWIVIALFGLALYVYPSFWVRSMYEAYDNPPSVNVPTLGAQHPPIPTVAQLAKKNNPNATAGPAGTTDFAALVKNMEKMLEPQINTPDLVSLPSPTAPSPSIRASGAKAQPDGAVSTKSLPQTAEEANKPVKSGGLEQGVSFQNTKPSPVIIVNQIPHQSSRNEGVAGTGDSARCPHVPDMREYIRRDMIPEQAPCPSQLRCPDMRQYIRKDSIPCWACKLK